MNNIEQLIQIEKTLAANGERLSESKALKQYGFDNILDYLAAKRDYLFSKWVPEVFYIDIENFAAEVEKAIQNNAYGIYIPIDNGIHAYHGNDTIDLNLCTELGVKVVELGYTGGTIIGSKDDLSILVIFPKEIGMDHYFIGDQLCDLIRGHVKNVIRYGNDILVNGKKVSGSMTRNTDKSFIWAAQVTFADYTDYIVKICNKKSRKVPSHIDPAQLTREVLEKEFIDWLQKK